MRTHVLAVGKLRPAYRTLCDEYLRRLSRYGPIVERQVREASRSATPAQRRREEAKRLADALPERGRLVVLDRTGTAWSSDELARRLERWRDEGLDTSLVIGGDWGLDPGLVAEARFRWSLGPLTLPHELARVVTLEQWYRAWTIIRGEPYHRGA